VTARKLVSYVLVAALVLAALYVARRRKVTP
jgi:hypothetical protein